MNLIGWITGNPLISGIALAVALIAAVVVERGCYGTERYEEGRKDERNYILSIPPDTTTKPVTVQEPKPIQKKRQATVVPVSTDYQAKIDSAVNAIRDSLERYTRNRLNPFEVMDLDTARTTIDGFDIAIPVYSDITAYPLDRIIETYLQLGSFQIPVRTVTHRVPVPTETAFTDVLLYGFFPGVFGTLIVLWWMGVL